MSGWVAGAVVVGSVVASQGAKNAANTQAAAAGNAAALQQQQYQQTRQDQMPFMEAGYGALNKLIPLASNYQKFGQAQFH